MDKGVSVADLFTLFSVGFPVRWTVRQRKKCAGGISRFAAESGMEAETVCLKRNGSEYFSVLINRPEGRDIVMISALDTPQMRMFHDHSASWSGNIRSRRTGAVTGILGAAALMSAVIYLTVQMNSIQLSARPAVLGVIALLTILSIILSRGVACRVNDSLNSSLAAAFWILGNHTDYGLIMVDGVFNGAGMAALADRYSFLKDKRIVYIDALDDGGTLFYGKTFPAENDGSDPDMNRSVSEFASFFGIGQCLYFIGGRKHKQMVRSRCAGKPHDRAIHIDGLFQMIEFMDKEISRYGKQSEKKA